MHDVMIQVNPKLHYSRVPRPVVPLHVSWRPALLHRHALSQLVFWKTVRPPRALARHRGRR